MERIFQNTSLYMKKRVIKKKTTNKMIDMIKQYKDLRAIV